MQRIYNDVEADLEDVEDEEAANLLATLFGEITAAADEAERKQLAEYQVLRMGRLVKNLKAEQTLLEAHKLETAGKLSRVERRMESLKSWTFALLNDLGIQKVKDGLVTVYTSGQAPAWDVIDEALVPDEFVRVYLKTTLATAKELGITDWIDRQEVAKSAIDEAFKETGEIPAGMQRDTERRHLVVR